MTVPDHMILHKFATAGCRPGYNEKVPFEEWMVPLIKQYKRLHTSRGYTALALTPEGEDLKVAYRAGLKHDWETYDNYVGMIELGKPEPKWITLNEVD